MRFEGSALSASKETLDFVSTAMNFSDRVLGKVSCWLPGILAALVCLVGCTGKSAPSPVTSMSVLLSPFSGRSLVQGRTLQVSAQVLDDASNAGVTWSLAGDGTLFEPTPSTVTYVAPSTSIVNSAVVITATSLANSSVRAYLPITLVPQGALANVLPISVTGGPTNNAVNSAFTSVTLCVPGTTTCNSIDGILVDTGSTGLRVLSSKLPSLPASTDSTSNPVSECVEFPDQSYLWGNVVLADVRIAGEVGASVPVHAISSPSVQAPASCSSAGTGVNLGTAAALGSNGILGVGYKQHDCGALCDPSAGGTPPSSAYYGCAGGTCSPSFVPEAQQVTNPASTFAADNNGIAVQLPGVVAPAMQLDGQITFGIGTQSNNTMLNTTVFTIDGNGFFTTNLSSTGQSLTSSTLDTGLNSLRFPDDALTACASSSFFCPSGSTSLASVQLGQNNQQSTINFVVDNADVLFTQNPGAAVLPTLAASNGTGDCSAGVGACQFEWGLPFFYGRIVFIAIEERSVPGGPLGPWFAYSTSFSSH